MWAMPADAEALERLEAALLAEPEDLALRVRVARLMFEAGRFEEALQHCMAVLNRTPGNREALTLAVRAAGRAAERPSHPAPPADRAPGRLGPAGPAPPPTPEEGQGSELELGPGLDQAQGFRFDPVRVGVGRQQAGAALRPIDLHLGVVEQPGVTLDEVAGMPAVKRRISTGFLSPLRHAEMRRLFGRSLRGGLLLYGPPGCGKTFLARATAGELGASFLAVDLGNVLDLWLSYSEQTLHEIFELARAHAPCLLFVDELDALGRKRAQRRYSVGRKVVAQLVAELHAVGQDAEGVVVLAASARPWEADVVLREPGRFDHRLLVLPPDQEAREAILRGQLGGREVAGLGVDELAARTEGLTAAELIGLCEQAVLAADRADPAAGPTDQISGAEVERLLAVLRPVAPAWFADARDHLRYSGESAVYDELAAFLRASRD